MRDGSGGLQETPRSRQPSSDSFLVSLAHKAAANVIRANRISIMDTPVVPPMVPASAVAMNVLK